MKKGISTIILILIVVLIILAGYLLYQIRPQPTAVKKGLTGLEIAKSNLNFIDRLRTNNNQYFLSLDCTLIATNTSNITQSICNFSNTTDSRLNAWAADAYLGFYRATGDRSFLDKAITEADIAISNPDNIRSVLPQLYEISKETKNEKYSNFISSAGNKLVNEQVNNALSSAALSRDLATAYKVTNDEKLLKVSRENLQKAKLLQKSAPIVYTIDNFTIYSYDCLIELVELELYETIRDPTLLNNVVFFIDNSKISTFANSFGSLNILSQCVELLAKLSSITNNKQYKNSAIIAENSAFQNFLDSDKSFIRNNILLQDQIFKKHFSDNSYQVFLLTNYFKDDRFEIGR